MSENEEIISYIKRAFELKSQECYKQAIEMLYKALTIEPDNSELLFQTGELYFLLHNYSRAIQYLEQVLENDKNHIQSLKLLEKIYIRQNELLNAKEIAENLYGLDNSVENLIDLIKLFGKLEQPENLNTFLPEINKSDRCLCEYAKVLHSNSKTDAALTAVNKSLALNPENIDSTILLGKIFFDKNEFDKSREIFQKFPKNSQDAEILNYQGLFALEDMNFIDAIKSFSKASNLDNKNPIYFYNLGNAYFLNGWKDEAVTAYKKAIQILSENLDYRYSLAYLYYEYKDYEKAQKEVDFILENNGKHYHTRVLMALLLLQNKNYIEAENILLTNLKDGIENNFTLVSLAKVELEIGKFDKAELHLKAVIDNNPDALGYKCDLGDVYIKEKKYTEASNIVEEILQYNSNYIAAYILGAKSAIAVGDLEAAKAFAQDAISLDINCAAGYYYLAQVRMMEKDFEEAIECMKRAITFDVTNAEYYAKMAEIYRLSGDVKTAFEYVKEAENIDNSEEYKILYKEFAALNRK